MIIFTTNINAYDIIPDHYYDPSVKYYMFYDKEIEQKGPWEFIKLESVQKCPVIEKYDSPVLNAYQLRTMSHWLFSEPHVWIDGCYTMTEQFVKNSKEFLDTNEITLMHHPAKRTFLQEVMKLYRCGFVPEERLYKFCRQVAATKMPMSFFDHTINCVIWRNYTPHVIDWNEQYWHWYLDYELYHGCQLTSALAEWMIYQEKLPRVPPQVDLDKSTRSKHWKESYDFITNNDERNFMHNIRRILKAAL